MLQPSPLKTQSPSSITLFENCPLQYAHRYIYKTLPFVETPQIKEGNDFHKAMYMRLGFGSTLSQKYSGFEVTCQALENLGGEMFCEEEITVDREFREVDSVDKWTKGMLTNKLDVKIKFKKTRKAIIIDWKTGKPKDDPTQLLINTVSVLAAEPNIDTVTSIYAYTAYGTTSDPIRFDRKAEPKLREKLMEKIHRIDVAHGSGQFEPRPSGLCKQYCDVLSCPHNGKR